MSDRIDLAVIGGDTRQCAAIGRFLDAGLSVRAYGLPPAALPPGTHDFDNWRKAVDGVRAVVLPLPATPDGVRVHMPLAQNMPAPPIAALFREIAPTVRIMGGRFSPTVRALAEELARPLYDYFASDELQRKNALPTAEGAVCILMKETALTVAGMPVAVTGYGRVSRALCELLYAMHAKVTVAARKESDLADAAAHGYATVSIAEPAGLRSLCHGQCAIFNTVPCWLFTDDVLKEMQKNTLLIDLASAPGGVDANAAGKYGIRVIWALSIPGKYAPVTAGRIVADTVLDDLKKEGIL